MKRIISILLILLLIFSLTACGAPDEIVKEKKLSKTNFETYLTVDVGFDGGVATNYSAYDGDNPEYAGGRWKWGTGTAVVKVYPKSANKTEFANCKVSLQVDFGSPFGSKNLDLILDENGKVTETVKLESQKHGIPKEGFTSTDYAVPVATYQLVSAEGEMKIHIKLDENGSVITEE
ncbi:MAG: hypothetical protein E7565_06325 [Ruminococcaceae bacterium]|nr:hypothetical protein [Oscillospiraceae bacterium]